MLILKQDKSIITMFLTPIWIEFASPEYDEALALRYDILRKPLDMEYTVEELSKEYKDKHLAIYNEQAQLLATCVLSLSKEAENTAIMRQVAVRENMQGKGVGAKLIEAFETQCRQLGIERIELAARQTAVPFYKKFDYENKGEGYVKIGIPHQDMFKNLV